MPSAYVRDLQRPVLTQRKQRELREQMEEYEKNFKHESEEVALVSLSP